jgi:hypothetical protein
MGGTSTPLSLLTTDIQAPFLPSRDPHLILDKDDRIIAFLAGRPEGTSWDASMADAVVLLEEFRACEPTLAQKGDRRGSFLAVAKGVSFGGGQKVRRTLSTLFLSTSYGLDAWKFSPPCRAQGAPSNTL